MLTQCQQCKKTYSISIEELPHSSSNMLCPHCDEMLGRLKRLGSDFFNLNEPQDAAQNNTLWGLGLFLSLSLFVSQVIFFKLESLSQKPVTRLWLIKFCLYLDCQIPDYKNLKDFEIMYGAFELTNNQYYVFQTVISNQAKFPQAYPAIKLSLLSFNGEIFSQRVFYPNDYLSQPKDYIQAAETIELSMKIAIPEQKVGGYTFELL